jgi:aspartyl-tRNA(Asn)/glutamyl-tRNA(Gln) amidotransferase subunit B
MNKTAVEYAMMAATAMNSTIASFSKLDRKNYFYPDLPKGYQISQYDLPLALGGYVEVDGVSGKKRVRLKRIHLEEDAGKLIHETERGTATGAAWSLVDYNRCGVPLIEIVSEPDIETAEEARQYLIKLKAILQYLGISDCKMEEGSLRCDANISMKPVGQEKYGTPAEIKNIGSFKSVFRALEYEIVRQTEVLSTGGKVARETRRFDEATGKTISMRSKESAEDYRYFPEPDLVPLVISDEWKESVRAGLPELPDARRTRFVEVFGLPPYDAGVLTASPRMAGFFEDVVRAYGNPKTVSNWVMGEIMRYLNAEGKEIEDLAITPQHLASMLALIDAGTISGKIAKSIFDEMCATGKTPEALIKEKGLTQISDTSALVTLVDRVIAENPSVVADYRAGKQKAMGFLVGAVMKETKGRANPGLVNDFLKERLDK